MTSSQNKNKCKCFNPIEVTIVIKYCQCPECGKIFKVKMTASEYMEKNIKGYFKGILCPKGENNKRRRERYLAKKGAVRKKARGDQFSDKELMNLLREGK